MLRQIVEKIPGLNALAVAAWSRYRRTFGPRQLSKRLRQRPSPLKVVIGASGVYDPGWVPTEVEYLNLLARQDWDRYFPENSIDILLAEHVWEHLTLEQGLLAARNCRLYLKPGGHLRVAVPDGLHPDPEYRERVKVGGTGPGAADHKVLFDYRSFSELFREAGFEVNLLEYFDESGQFHASDWDPAEGRIHRSWRFDERNCDGRLNYTSVILDANKPQESSHES